MVNKTKRLNCFEVLIIKVFKSSDINPAEMICFLTDENCVGTTPEHAHEFIEIEYIYSGSGIQIINGVEYQVSKGEVLFFNIGDVHSYYPIKDFSIINIMFFPHFINSDLYQYFNNRESSTTPVIKLNTFDVLELEKLIFLMANEFASKQFGYIQTLKSYLDIILIRIIRGTTLKNIWNKKLLPIVEFIENNYGNIKPLDVANFSSYNQSYLSKMFKDNFGITITEFINKKRIENAIKLLEETDLSIELICYKVGFKEKKYFYKSFKAITGTTPSFVRKR